MGEAADKWGYIYYGKFVGTTCSEVKMKEEDGVTVPVLVFQHPDGGELELEVSCGHRKWGTCPAQQEEEEIYPQCAPPDYMNKLP